MLAAGQEDLFGESGGEGLPGGLLHAPRFITVDEEATLLEGIATLELKEAGTPMVANAAPIPANKSLNHKGCVDGHRSGSLIFIGGHWRCIGDHWRSAPCSRITPTPGLRYSITFRTRA